MRTCTAIIRSVALAGLFFVCSSANAQPSELEPFETWSAKRPNWTNDVSDVSYFAMRCGALYGVVATAFKNASNASAENYSQASDLTTRSLQLNLVGFAFGSEAGWKQQVMKERLSYLYGEYVKVISSNRTKHNNMFHGFVEGDWAFCVRYEKQFWAEANAIIKK